MNAYRPRLFLVSTFFLALFLLVLPNRSCAFHVIDYYNGGTVSPSATQICR